MKLKDGIPLSELEKYKFQPIHPEEKESDDTFVLSSFDYWYFIDHARRGQCYYLLISETYRAFQIWASEPDGSGSFVEMPDVVISLVADGLVELSNQPQGA